MAPPPLLVWAGQAFWLRVPPGFCLPQAVVTNRPDVAERVTERRFDVPAPTRSVVVVRGDCFARPLVTKRPVRALLLTERPLAITVSFPRRGSRFAGYSSEWRTPGRHQPRHANRRAPLHVALPDLPGHKMQGYSVAYPQAMNA